MYTCFYEQHCSTFAFHLLFMFIHFLAVRSFQILHNRAFVHFVAVKARSNGSNTLVKHYPRLLAGVGWCLISVGLCWMLENSNESNTIQQCWISVPGTKLWCIFDHKNENVEWRWMKLLNKVKLHPPSSNTIQYYPTFFIVLFNRVKQCCV